MLCSCVGGRLRVAAAAAFIVSGLVASAASASVNLIANPSFESPALGGGDVFGSTSWGVYGGGTFTLAANVGVPAHEGSQVFKTFGFSGAFQDFPVSAGDTVDASAWMMNWSNDAIASTNTSAYAQLLLIFLDSSNAQVGTTQVASFMQPVPAVDTWIQRSLSVAAPAGSATVRFQLNTGNPLGGAIMYDDTFLSITPVPAPGAGALLGLAGVLVSRRRRA